MLAYACDATLSRELVCVHPVRPTNKHESDTRYTPLASLAGVAGLHLQADSSKAWMCIWSL